MTERKERELRARLIRIIVDINTKAQYAKAIEVENRWLRWLSREVSIPHAN